MIECKECQLIKLVDVLWGDTGRFPFGEQEWDHAIEILRKEFEEQVRKLLKLCSTSSRLAKTREREVEDLRRELDRMRAREDERRWETS